jgi:hypothetical protein
VNGCYCQAVPHSRTTLVDRVRTLIYEQIVTAGHAPTVAEVANLSGGSEEEIADAFRSLADAHIVVLKAGTTDLWSAPPFSAVPSSFTVQSGQRSWYAPCAWDMFGIPAALDRDATLHAQCAWSGVALPAAVKDRQVSGAGIIHLVVPARHFWDDIFDT